MEFPYEEASTFPTPRPTHMRYRLLRMRPSMRICKWWTSFTVARPILLPTHQPTAHGAHTESLGATHPVARTPSSWDATGNYFQLPLLAVAQGSSDMEFRISGAAQVQLAVNILLNTDSPVCACCNKFKYQSSTNQLYPNWANK